MRGQKRRKKMVVAVNFKDIKSWVYEVARTGDRVEVVFWINIGGYENRRYFRSVTGIWVI